MPPPCAELNNKEKLYLHLNGKIEMNCTVKCVMKDVFSCFSQDQEEFVEEAMAEFLEEFGFTICCHRRDFDLGIPIEQNIQDATVHSRRIICVLSR